MFAAHLLQCTMTNAQASSELREIAARAKALTAAIDVHAVSAGTVHAAVLEAMCSLSGGMLRLIKSFGEPLLVSLGPSLLRVSARALTVRAYSSRSLELQHVIGAMKLDQSTPLVSRFKALVGEPWQGFTFYYDIVDDLNEGDYVSLQVRWCQFLASSLRTQMHFTHSCTG